MDTTCRNEKGQKDEQWSTKHYTEQYEKCEDTKVVIRSRRSKNKHYNGRNEKGQNDEQWSTKHHTENYRLSNRY